MGIYEAERRHKGIVRERQVSFKFKEIMKNVVLIKFNGQETAPLGTENRENYWKLIGQTGLIVDTNSQRHLVQFTCDLNSFGLENHNSVKNSLWILHADLIPEDSSF